MSPFLWKNINVVSGWWQLKYFLFFTPTTWGQIDPIWLSHNFSNELVQPPTDVCIISEAYQRLPGSAEPNFHGKISPNLPGGRSQLSTIQLPIPEDGIFECLWEEEIWIFYPVTSPGGEMGATLLIFADMGFFTVHTLLLVDLVYMLLVGEMCTFLEKCFDLDSWNVSKRFVQQPAAGSRDRVATQLRRFPEFVFCMAKKKTWALIKKMIADCIFFSPQITEITWKIMKTPSRLTCVCPAHWRLVSRISVGTEGELKEYTYVMENRDMPKTVLEDVTETWRFGWWNVVGFCLGCWRAK